MTELKTKPFDTLEVGKTYVTRGGVIRKITECRNAGTFPYVSHTGDSFKPDGSWLLDPTKKSPLDLIAEVIEKPVYRVKAGSEAVRSDEQKKNIKIMNITYYPKMLSHEEMAGLRASVDNVVYHDPRVTMEQVGELMAQDGEFSPSDLAQEWNRKSIQKSIQNAKPVGKYEPSQYRAALDDFIHGGNSKDTRDVIKDALRVMGGV